MKDEQIVTIVTKDILNAKNAKKDIEKRISDSKNEYYGEPYGNEVEGSSKLVVKDIKKAVEWFIPNAIESFVSSNKIVSLQGITGDDVQRAKMHEMVLNYQFVRQFDRYKFLYDSIKTMTIEGTVVARCGWELESKESIEEFNGIVDEQLIILQEQGLEVVETVDNADGTYNVKVKQETKIKNNPTAKIILNENFYIDPEASTVEDALFCASKFEMTASGLKQNLEGYDEDAVKQLLEQDPMREGLDSSLASDRETLNADRGFKRVDSEDNTRRKYTLYEYWGNLDLNEDGIAEAVRIIFSNNVILLAEDNPYPDGKKPFISAHFMEEPNVFWGDSLPMLLSDNQKIRTAIMRGFIDNAARSNNGIKFAKKGALDVTNYRRLKSGNPLEVVEVNGDKNDIWDGAYNQISPSMFSLYEQIQVEAEALSGITRYTQGLDSSSLNSTATGISTITSMSQKRMLEIVRRFSERYLKELFRKWISYNKQFLDETNVMRIAGQFYEFTPDDLEGRFDIDIVVGTEGLDNVKANQITMIMQQLGNYGNNIPPMLINRLFAELFNLWKMPDIAEEISNYQPQPNEMEQAMAQFQLQEQEAEAARKSADAMYKQAKAQETAGKANQVNISNMKEAYGVGNDGNREKGA